MSGRLPVLKKFPRPAISVKPWILRFVLAAFIQSQLLYYSDQGAQKKAENALSVPSSKFFEQFSSVFPI